MAELPEFPLLSTHIHARRVSVMIREQPVKIPVQGSWISFPGKTGVPLDYVIVPDEILAAAAEAAGTEQSAQPEPDNSSDDEQSAQESEDTDDA